MEKFIVKQIKDWEVCAKSLLDRFSAKTLCFQGDLGAGKTTFIQAICAELGIKDEVTSPTYSIIQEYGNDSIVYHMDLYRLESYDQLMEIGIEEYLYSDHFCLIEWPDLILDHFNDLNIVKIEIQHQNDGERIVFANLYAPNN